MKFLFISYSSEFIEISWKQFEYDISVIVMHANTNNVSFHVMR